MSPTTATCRRSTSTKKYHHGHDLDEDRRIDYAKDGTPIGVELLGVDGGVRLDGLPSPEAILEALNAQAVPILDGGVRRGTDGSATRANDPAAAIAVDSHELARARTFGRREPP